MADTSKKTDNKKSTSNRRMVVEEVENTQKEEEKKPTEETKTEEKGVEETKEESMEEKPSEEDKKEEDEKEEVKQDEKVQKSEAPLSLKQVLMIAVPTALVVAALTGGILYYLNNNKIETTPSPTPTTVPTASPVSEKTDEEILAQKSELKIEVLNGSGVAGRAGEVKNLLEKAGYVGVETGNADSFDFTETQIAVKKDSGNDYFKLVSDDLSDTYVVASDSATLEDSSDFDVVITVGKSLQ